MRKAFVFVGLVAAGFLVASSSAGFALPPKKSFGCTMAQIQKAATQTAAGRACAKKQDDSVINNTTFIVFVCTSDGVYCCPENATSASQCTKVSSARNSLGSVNAVLGSMRAANATLRPAASPTDR